MTWISRVCRFGGPGLTIISIGVDLATGEPADKVALSTSVSLGAVVLAVMVIPGPGWFGAVPAIIFGMAAGVGADHFYDQHLKRSPVIIDDGWAFQPG